MLTGNQSQSHKHKFQLNDLFALFLLYILTFQPNTHKQIDRLLCILLAFVLILRSNCNSFILSNTKFVYIGNNSYAIYLIHWSLFELYKYLNVEVTAYEREMPLESK